MFLDDCFSKEKLQNQVQFLFMTEYSGLYMGHPETMHSESNNDNTLKVALF